MSGPGEASAVVAAHPLVTFTPSAMAPEVLEAIFVKREPLAKKIVAGIKAGTSSSAKQHWLLVGPRGIGKTHLLSIVYHRVVNQKSLRRKLVIAWLREEAWEVASYLNLLEAILQAVAADQGGAAAERITDTLDALLDVSAHEAEQAAERLLLEVLADRTLLLMAENLDEVFQGLGVDGQRSLRALIENTDRVLVVASTPSLFAGVSSHAQPFYGLFTVQHLHELTLDEARELLERVAELRGDSKLAKFLATPTAEARLRVISELAGGHPRIWVLFANCVSIELLDELVPLFVKMLDDLTPYYQERMRGLSPQQRRIVTYLADVGGAQPVKDIARACRLDQRSTAKLLGDLEAKGFARRAAELAIPTTGDRRLAAYELREPLMRLCLDVKESRGKPLRLIVGFLRHWYDRELFPLIAGASDGVVKEYLTEAVREFVSSRLGVANATDEQVVNWSILQQREFEVAVGTAAYASVLKAGIDRERLFNFESDLLSVWPDVVTITRDMTRQNALDLHTLAVTEARRCGMSLRLAKFAAASSIVFANSTVVGDALREAGVDDRTQTAVLSGLRAAGELIVDAWSHAADGEEYDIAIRIMAAAVQWGRDHDRAHLLALPVEEREVLMTLLEPDDTVSSGAVNR